MVTYLVWVASIAMAFGVYVDIALFCVYLGVGVDLGNGGQRSRGYNHLECMHVVDSKVRPKY